MSDLSGLGIALSIVFGLLFLAFVFEVYYLLWWKRRITGHDSEEERTTTSGNAPSFLPVVCFNHHPSSLSSAPLNTAEDAAASSKCYGVKAYQERDADPDMVMFHSLSNPMGALFTIKEETREDLESEDARSKRGSRGRSLSDVVVLTETPYLTPLSSPAFFTPPMTPLSNYSEFNPLFETMERREAVSVMPSPPSKFKFLRDADEKLGRRALMEETTRLQSVSVFYAETQQELLHHQHPCFSHNSSFL